MRMRQHDTPSHPHTSILIPSHIHILIHHNLLTFIYFNIHTVLVPCIVSHSGWLTACKSLTLLTQVSCVTENTSWSRHHVARLPRTGDLGIEMLFSL